MKRFITYLYLYEQGQKSINVGFVRVDVRGNTARMEISVRNLSRILEKGMIYALVYQKKMIGIELGDMRIINGQGKKTIEVSTIDIVDSGYTIDDVVGISIDFQNKAFIASCWKDEYADCISKNEIHIHTWTPPQLEELVPIVIEVKESCEHVIETKLEEVIEEPEEKADEKREEEIENEKEKMNTCCSESIYKKIDLGQIHSLPSKNWYLCNNSFLIHGFWNYGYLVLKKTLKEDGMEMALGIPGIFEKPEMLMAVLFGFPEFEAIPEEIKNVNLNIEKTFANIEKNQEPEVGTFGCWFVKL